MTSCSPPPAFILHEALRLLDCGFSVIPARNDGSKAPALRHWAEFQTRLPTEAEVRLWWGKVTLGVKVIGGEVSGNLETLDFDAPGLYPRWAALVCERGGEDVLASLPVVASPGGGHKAFWRCNGFAPRTEYLAYAPVPGEPKQRTILIETQGAHKPTLVPPTPARCHPSGIAYRYQQGHLACVPTLGQGTRDALLAAARTFNLWTPPPVPAPRPRPAAPREGLSPGDDFNARGEWEPLLRSLGLVLKKESGGTSHWGWADADKQTCVTLGRGGSNRIYNFSSSAAPLEPETSYDLFGAYARIRHGGDFGAAAAALKAAGYGG